MNYQEFKQAVIAAATEKEVKDYELYYSESAETQTEIFKTEVKGFTTGSNLGVCLKCLVMVRWVMHPPSTCLRKKQFP